MRGRTGGPRMVWGEVVLRTSWARCLAVSSPHLAILAVPLIWGLHRVGTSDLDLPFFGLLYLAMAILSVGIGRHNCVRLGAGDLTIRTGFRTRRLAASDIVAVTLEHYQMSQFVTVWMRDGTCSRLGPAGRTEGLVWPTFDRDWHLVGDWWLTNGGHVDHAGSWRPPTLADGLRDFDWRPSY